MLNSLVIIMLMVLIEGTNNQFCISYGVHDLLTNPNARDILVNTEAYLRGDLGIKIPPSIEIFFNLLVFF